MWLLIVICVALFLMMIGFFHRTHGVKHFPPGPRGLPLIGNLIQIRRIMKQTGYDWAVWTKLSKLYGPVLRVRLGMRETLVVLTGRPAVLEFLGKRELDGRPDSFDIKLRCLGARRGIVFNDGQEWAKQKRFALKVLKDFGFGTRTMEALVQEDSIMLCEMITKKMLNKEIPSTDFVEIVSLSVISNLWNLIAGKRCDIANEELEVLEILRIIKKLFRTNTLSNQIWRFFPFLRFIPFFSVFCETQRLNSKLSNFFMKEIAEHKNTRIPGQPRDLIDTYFDEIDSNAMDETSSFNELQLVVIVKDFFMAGIETTSNLIGFVIVYLATYPDVQIKLQYELDQVIESNEVPQMHHKQLLPYLNATIVEVSRLANIASTTIAHRVLDDCSIMGFNVEKNWSVIGSLQSIHMDADHWVDAESFRPERFIDKNGNFVEDPWVIPFGFGHRKCPGENLAKINLFLFVANLMQKFRFSLAPMELAPNLLGNKGFTNEPPFVNIIIRSRCTDAM